MPKTAGMDPARIISEVYLEDCVFALLEDAYNRVTQYLVRRGQDPTDETNYEGFRVQLGLDYEFLVIRDNCGGVPLEEAKGYVARLEQAEGSPEESGTLGELCGISPTHIAFQTGQYVTIKSSTETEAYIVGIKVDRWDRDLSEWEVELHEREAWGEPGTEIRVQNLYANIENEIADPFFLDKSARKIARYYASLLEKGFEISIEDPRLWPLDPKESQPKRTRSEAPGAG